MKMQVLVLVVAGALGCSSKGEAGPQGPTGPTGPRGDTGAGPPGLSVQSATLTSGSADCPTGGSQFTSASGTTFACNGSQGPQGIQGPRGLEGIPGPSGPPGGTTAQVLDATGVIGRFLAYRWDNPTGQQLVIAVEVWQGNPVVTQRFETSGALPIPNSWPNLVYTQLGCQGQPYMRYPPFGPARQVIGDDYYATTGTFGTIRIYSERTSPTGCTDSPGGYDNTVSPAVLVTPPPVVGPLSVSWLP
jgi:hypothetical protein